MKSLPQITMVQPIIIEDETQSETIQQTNIIRTKKINFIHGFRPIYYFSRAFSLMPFSIQCDSNGDPEEPKVYLSELIIFSISIILCLAMAYDEHHNLPFMYTLVGKCTLLTNMISSTVIIALDMYNRSNLICILSNFNKFDKNVSSIIYIKIK